MSALAMIRYTLDDVLAISANGFDYTIPETTMALISSLSLQVGAPTYVKTPIFQKRVSTTDSNNTGSGNTSKFSKNDRNGFRRHDSKEPEEWPEGFVVTPKIAKNASEIETKMGQIRLLLNKLSTKTFNETRDNLVVIVNELIEMEDKNNENMIKISSAIFTIASSNKYYSKMYADLYTSLLLTHNEQFQPIFKSSCDSYMSIFQNIQYVSQEENPDMYYKNNKDNENRKALSAFFVNLALNGSIEKNVISEMTKNILSLVLEYMTIPNRSDEVVQLFENVVILYNLGLVKDINPTMVGDESVETIIKRLSSEKMKNHKSLPNKVIFACMDLLERKPVVAVVTPPSKSPWGRAA